jgi:F-type H+-transporting ATPase subunit epsilon
MALHVSVVTPEKEVWSGEANFISARAAGGEIGILPGHAPFLGALRHSAVKIENDEGIIVLAVHGGFIEVYNNEVKLLGRGGERAEEIDVGRARRARDEAVQAIQEEDSDEARQAFERAEARLRAAGAVGLTS